MSTKFNRFAVRVDELAKRKFNDYEVEKSLYDIARDNYESFPEKAGASAGYAAKAADYKAKYLKAKASYDALRGSMIDSIREVVSIRNELAKALTEAYRTKSSDIDAGVAILLTSGILTEHEYSDLIDEYIQNGNATMARLTGAAAARAADGAKDENTQRNLRMIAHRGMDNPARRILADFDNISYAYEKTMKNPSMIKSWAQITADAIQNF